MKNPLKWRPAPGAPEGLQLYGNDGRLIVSSMTEIEAVSLKNEAYLAILKETIIALETCGDNDTAEKVRLRMAEIEARLSDTATAK